MSKTYDLLNKIIGKVNVSVKTEKQSLTEAQKAQARLNLGVGSIDEVAAEVLARLQTPVFGRVDSDNNIILTGELADGTYTLKYEDAEGNVTVIGTLDTSAGYNNQLPISTDTDGSIYNGVGYKVNTRLSASSGYTETAINTGNDVYLTGFIPVKTGDILRFYNMTISDAADENYTGRIYVFDTSKVGAENGSAISYASVSGWNVVSVDGNVTQITYGGADGFIRINADYIDENSIITINQEIPEEEPAYTNQIPNSINADGTPYNGGQGWKTNTRLNSSGTETEQTGWEVTGFIPVTATSDVYLANIDWNSDGQNRDYLGVYDSSFAKITSTRFLAWLDTNNATALERDANGNPTYFNASILETGNFGGVGRDNLAKMAYIRISACEINNSSIITVDEPIA